MYKVETDDLFKIISEIMHETYNAENSDVFKKNWRIQEKLLRKN